MGKAFRLVKRVFYGAIGLVCVYLGVRGGLRAHAERHAGAAPVPSVSTVARVPAAPATHPGGGSHLGDYVLVIACVVVAVLAGLLWLAARASRRERREYRRAKSKELVTRSWIAVAVAGGLTLYSFAMWAGSGTLGQVGRGFLGLAVTATGIALVCRLLVLRIEARAEREDAQRQAAARIQRRAARPVPAAKPDETPTPTPAPVVAEPEQPAEPAEPVEEPTPAVSTGDAPTRYVPVEEYPGPDVRHPVIEVAP